MRRLLALAAAAATATPAGAQAFEQVLVQTGPQVVQYHLKSPINETITEFAIPLVAVVPVTRALSVDVGTAWAASRVHYSGGTSTISGLTDTQLRANYSLGSDFVVLTAGVNLPTGRSTAEPEEVPAASRIANDFFAFPISSMGTGMAFTGGIAIARPAGAWNVGAGGSVRLAEGFEPVQPAAGTPPRYEPGNEYKLRLGADRPLGDGQVAVGFTYSKFGQDDFGGTLYNTGDRYLGQAGISNITGAGTLTVALWNLYRGRGELVGGGEVPWDNITNLGTTLSVRTSGHVTVEPNLQLRSWLQSVAGSDTEPARTDRSVLAELGVRGRVELGPATIFPGAGYTVGSLAAGADRQALLTGFRLSLGGQLR